MLFMLQLRVLLWLDFLFLKGNAVHLFGIKCVIVCFQCTIHSAPRLLLLAKVCLSFCGGLSGPGAQISTTDRTRINFCKLFSSVLLLLRQ